MQSNPHSVGKRWILGLFFIVIFGPVVFAYVLIQKNERLALKTNHHGDLITPLKPVRSLLDYTPFQGKWLILIVSPYECHADAADRLHAFHQLQKALNKESGRVKQAVITFSEPSLRSCEAIFATYPEMTQVSLSERDFESQLGAFSHAIKRQTQGEFFIVDPKGNIMMHYDATVAADDVLKDLKRLLRVSKIG